MYFEEKHRPLKLFHNEIVKAFKPESVHSTTFNVAVEKMEFEVLLEDVFAENERQQQERGEKILRIIYEGDGEKIILEYFNRLTSIEHFYRYVGRNDYEGTDIMRFYWGTVSNLTLIVGNDLSLDIDDYKLPIEQFVSDRSQWPLLTVERTLEGTYTRTYENGKDEMVIRDIAIYSAYIDSIVTSNP